MYGKIMCEVRADADATLRNPERKRDARMGGVSGYFMKCVFLFESVHRVMKAEKLLKGEGIRVDLIPVPREISSDCGVALEFSAESEAKALLILRENRILVADCYTRDLSGKFEKKQAISSYEESEN